MISTNNLQEGTSYTALVIWANVWLFSKPAVYSDNVIWFIENLNESQLDEYRRFDIQYCLKKAYFANHLSIHTNYLNAARKHLIN